MVRQVNVCICKLLFLSGAVQVGEEGGEWRGRGVRLPPGIGHPHKGVGVTRDGSTHVDHIEPVVDPEHLQTHEMM